MPDPQQHAEDRGFLESMLKKIPGFQGYLEQGYRRESDRLQRAYLADQLQRAKQGVTDYSLALTNAGQLDALPQCDQMRSRLDRLIARLRGSVSGYSGFFDFVQIDEDVLDEVYAHDSALIDSVDSLANKLKDLPEEAAAQSSSAVSEIMSDVASIEAAVDKREDILRGVGN